MTASERRRPVTARDFNRLLFALLLLAALTVLARLITRQESKAEMQPEEQISLAQWAQTADALFLRGEWQMAADAYYGAIEAAAASGQSPEPRMQKKLALCLAQSGDARGAMHYLRLYRLQLLQWQNQPSLHDLPPLDSLRDPAALAGEVAEVESLIQHWGGSGS
jgi:hypothetical protein